jgi:hypothetical protein
MPATCLDNVDTRMQMFPHERCIHVLAVMRLYFRPPRIDESTVPLGESLVTTNPVGLVHSGIPTPDPSAWRNDALDRSSSRSP